MAGQNAAAQAPAPPYVMDLGGCSLASIAEHGVTETDTASDLERLWPHMQALKARTQTGARPILDIVDETADIERAQRAMARLGQGARTLVFFGMGGSGLGGSTLAQLSGWNIPGYREAAGQKSPEPARPRTRFYDNLDGASLGRALHSLDLATTRFIFTSKSGNTAETLVQAVAVLGAIEAAGLKGQIPALCLGLTEPGKAGVSNHLRALLSGLGVDILDHDTGIGGRFSVLSNVGLLPALARGLDVRALRAGARSVIDSLHAAGSAADFAPALGAALLSAFARKHGTRVEVMLPYCDRLQAFANWFQQLKAESLGKAGHGMTPLAALGPRDQHSLLQLFMDGPREHLITLVRVLERDPAEPTLSSSLCAQAGIAFLGGKRASDLVEAQTQGIPAALAKAGRPVRRFDVAKLDERAMGALLMHFMIETMLSGWLMGLDPFDQPAVELGKLLTRERL